MDSDRSLYGENDFYDFRFPQPPTSPPQPPATQKHRSLPPLLANIVTYISRFVGDFVVISVGAISFLPTIASYWQDMGILTAAPFRWITLALGFVVCSYLIWAKTEHARTRDAIAVLRWDAERIRNRLKLVIEQYDWPPTYPETTGPPEDRKDIPRVAKYPMSTSFPPSTGPVFAALHRVRERIEEHNQLVYEVAAEHKIEDISTLEPEHLHQFTMLREFDHYIETLKARSMPPPSWLQALSMRRFRR